MFGLSVNQNYSTKRLWFTVIEHLDIIVKMADDILQQRMLSWHNECNVFFHWFPTGGNTTHFCSLDEIPLLLFVAGKPAEEESGTLCLMIVISTAHIEHNIGIPLKELLYNTDYGLGNFTSPGDLTCLGFVRLNQ